MSSKQPSLLYLNDYCLEHIFSFLDTFDQLTLGLLSPEFKPIIDRLIGKRIFNLNDIHNRLPYAKAMDIFNNYAPAIKRVFMPFPIWNEATDRYFLIPQNFTNISEVHFNFPLYFNCKTMRMVFMASRGIRILHCQGRELFDHHCLFIATLSEIEILNIEHNVEITGVHLDKLKKLKVLNIRGCSKFVPKNLIKICRATKLRSLNIAECNHLKDDVFEVILETQTSLKDLTVNHCYQGANADMLARLPALQSVCIIWYCQRPHKLTNFLDILGKHHANSIRKLEIDHSKLHRESEHAGILRLKQLRQVSIISDADLCDRFLLNICKNCPKLQKINISGCRSVTRAAVVDLVKRLEDLHTLDLRHCSQFTNTLYDRLVQARRTFERPKQLTVYVWDSMVDEMITGFANYPQQRKLVELSFEVRC